MDFFFLFNTKLNPKIENQLLIKLLIIRLISPEHLNIIDLSVTNPSADILRGYPKQY